MLTRFFKRVFLVVCIIVLGGFSALNAFRNGTALMPGYDGFAAGAALTVLLFVSAYFVEQGLTAVFSKAGVKAFGLLSIGAFTLCVALAMSIGAIANHRTELVGGKEQQIEAYQRAQADWNRLNAEIAAADAKGRKVPVSLRQELKAAESEMKVGRPASSDAQSEELAWVTRHTFDADTIGKALPIGLAVAVDLAFTGCFIALGMVGQKQPVPRQQEPAQAKRKVKRKTKRKAKAPVIRFPVIADRKKLAVAAND
jgi:cell division protein FtsL